MQLCSVAASDTVLAQSFALCHAQKTMACRVSSPAALQPFSGAPGYLPGFPVLAGVLAADPAAASSSAAAAPKAVSRLTGGLQLPGATAAGRCSGSSSSAVGVGFGYNTTSSCRIAMTLAQVSQMSEWQWLR